MRTALRTRLSCRWLLLVAIALTLTVSAAAVTKAAAQGGNTYVVEAGDTLGLVARTYGISVAALMRANDITDPDLVWIGQRLTIPGASATPATVTAGTRSDVYVVKLGDRLGDIAAALGVDSAALLRANDIDDPDLLWVGQTLVVPRSGGSAAPASSVTSQQGPVRPAPAVAPQASSDGSGYPQPDRYVVRSGDTLGQIAARFRLSSSQLARANGLSSPDMIYLGLSLWIPSAGDWTMPGLSGQASRFVVSISQQRCWVYQGNAVVADWICSTGRKSAPTLTGRFTIQNKIEEAYGRLWNFWMPYWMGLYTPGAQENGIHGIPYNKTWGTRTWEDELGTPVTYGCVLLSDEHVKQLFDMAWVGMPVIITQ